MPARSRRRGPDAEDFTPRQQWAVQTENWAGRKAIFQTYRTRDEAEASARRLRWAGCSCIVVEVRQ